MCEAIDKIKIVESPVGCAAINSDGKIVLWNHTKIPGKYDTIETNISCKDICLYIEEITGNFRWVMIDQYGYLNYIFIDSKNNPYLESMNLDIKAKKICSIPNKSNLLILEEDGTIISIGKNTFPFPDYKEFDNVFKDIVLSENFAVALTYQGTLFSWGNFFNDNITVPLKYYKPEETYGVKISKMVSGRNIVLLLYENGKVDGWGDNKYNQLNIPDIIKKDAINNIIVKDLLVINSLCFAYIEFLDNPDQNTIIYWGNPSQEFADLNSIYKFDYCVESPYFFNKDNTFSNKNIRNLYGGRNSIYAVTTDGTVISWGLTGTSGNVYVPDLLVKKKMAIKINIKNFGFNDNIETLISKLNKNYTLRPENFSYTIQNFKADKITTKEDILALKARKGVIRTYFEITDSNGAIVKRFEKQELLGAGTFGVVYSIQDLSDGKNYTLKVPRNPMMTSSLKDFTEEIVSQIILFESSKEFYAGPICGKILCVALDSTKNFPFIIQTSFEETLGNYYFNNFKNIMNRYEDSEIILKNKLLFLEGQILRGIAILCQKLNFINKLENIEFNHRDMKADNIMVTLNSDNSIKSIYLIDFGYSCININGYKLGASVPIFRHTKCFNPTRDLNFLIISLYNNFKNQSTGNSSLTSNTKKFFEYITSFYVKNKICEAYKGCDYEISLDPSLSDFNKVIPDPSEPSGFKSFSIFQQSYKFLNKSYIFNPKTSPNNLIKLIEIYLTNNFNIESVKELTPSELKIDGKLRSLKESGSLVKLDLRTQESPEQKVLRTQESPEQKVLRTQESPEQKESDKEVMGPLDYDVQLPPDSPVSQMSFEL
jgi:serine/threonine protein kinase/alpha-tubulin suppressor-like RCC1 family protein